MIPKCTTRRWALRLLGALTTVWQSCRSCSVDPKMHHPAKRSLAMREHTGGVLRDFIVANHRDICREHSLIGLRNCLMTESANSLSAAAGPELSTTRNPIANLASDSATAGLAWVRVCAVAPRCLSAENASRTMTVLHHALCGDDFHQTPVSIIFSEKCSKFFFLVLWAIQHRRVV